MDDLIVKFCEDRRSWFFVIGGTLVLGLVLVLPGVDEYIAVCAEESDVVEKLALAEESANLLAGFEARRSEQAQKVADRLDKTLNESNESDYRNSVVKLVRDTGCQLRRINIGTPSSRNWGQQDNPLEKSANKKLKPTGFQLERRQVNLSLAGTAASVRKLIEQFEQQDKQVHVHALDLKPGTGAGRRVELSMELWYFTLKRKSA